MINLDELWNEQMVVSRDPQSVSRERSNPRPMDYSSIHKNFSSASAYALSNPTSYPGQIIAVLSGDGKGVYFLDLSSDCGLTRVGNLIDTELSAENKFIYHLYQKDGIISADYRNIKAEDLGDNKLSASQICDLSDSIDPLSTSIHNKIFIDDSIAGGMCAYNDLSIIKISKKSYDEKCLKSELCSNTLYIVSSDYIDAYGQQLCNIWMSDEKTTAYEGIATTKPYVDTLVSGISSNTSAMMNNLWNKFYNNFHLSGYGDELSDKKKYPLSCYCDCIYDLLLELSAWKGKHL